MKYIIATIMIMSMALALNINNFDETTITNISPFEWTEYPINYNSPQDINNVDVEIYWNASTGGITGLRCFGSVANITRNTATIYDMTVPKGTNKDLFCEIKGWGKFKYDMIIYKDGLEVLRIDPWFNTTWNNRIGINITSTWIDLDDYEMPMNISYLAGMNNTAGSEFIDLRFTEEDGDGELDYWVQEVSNGNWVYLYVELNGIEVAETGNIQAYMYYNTSGVVVVNASNGDETFNFFDDFDNLDDWNTFSGAPAVAGGILTLSTGAGTEKINTTDTFAINTSTLIRTKVTTCAASKSTVIGYQSNSNDEGTGEGSFFFYWQSTSGAFHNSMTGSISTQTAITLSTATTVYEIYRNSTTSTHIHSGHSMNVIDRSTTNIPSVSLPLHIGARDNCVSETDFIAVRDRISPDPTFIFDEIELIPAITTFNISINTPINETTIAVNITDVNFTVTGSEASYNCNLTFDSINVSGNITTLNDTLTSLSTGEQADGTYMYYIDCLSGTVSNVSMNNTITIDVPLVADNVTSVAISLSTDLYNSPPTYATCQTNVSLYQEWNFTMAGSAYHFERVVTCPNGCDETYDTCMIRSEWLWIYYILFILLVFIIAIAPWVLAHV